MSKVEVKAFEVNLKFFVDATDEVKARHFAKMLLTGLPIGTDFDTLTEKLNNLVGLNQLDVIEEKE